MRVVWKRMLSLLLAVLLCFSVSLPAFAAETADSDVEAEYELELDELPVTMRTKTATVSTTSKGPRRAPAATGEKGTSRVLFYSLDPNLENAELLTTTVGKMGGTPAHAIRRSDGTYAAAYCLQHWLPGPNDVQYEWDNIGETQKGEIIGTIIALGFQNNSSSGWARGDANSQWLVTQFLVWATVSGYVKMGSDHLIHVDAAVDADIEKMAPHLNQANAANFKSYYQSLKKKIEDFRKIPSFAYYPEETFAGNSVAASSTTIAATTNDAIPLEGDDVPFTATKTDTNSVLANFDFTGSIPGVTFARNGNSLVLSSDTAFSSVVPSKTVYASKSGGKDAVAVWVTPGDYQDFATYYKDGKTSIPAQIRVGTVQEQKTGLKIVKTSVEDEIIAGISFTITANDGSAPRHETTNSAGEISLADLPKFKKTPLLEEDGKTVVKDEKGDDVYTDSDEPVIYTITENEPIRYIHLPDQTFNPIGSKSTFQFDNRLKKFNVTFKKNDSETAARPQGDATFKNAKYGLYLNGDLKATYMTDENGKFTTDWFPCTVGSDRYTIKEIEPPEGYLLNPKVYTVDAAAENTRIEYNPKSITGTDDVKKNVIEIFKGESDERYTTTGYIEPEAGAEFEVYLTAAGSYENAYDTERDYLITNERGLAVTKKLPYGVYTIHQVKGMEGREIMPDKTKFVQDDYVAGSEGVEDNRVFAAFINGPILRPVQVVKKDAETGNIIPVAGIQFKVRNVATGEFVTQYIMYQTPRYLDVYDTDESGTFYMPEPVLYGNYELIEVDVSETKAYVLDSTPVPFSITGDSPSVVVVTKSNMAQKGIINVKKEGEVFASVEQIGNVYRPIYEVRGLEGAVYEIHAATDITTPDGSLRAEEGELVDTITTTADGWAASKELYLGKYIVTEVKAPEGMVLNDTPHEVELVYAGQEISVTDTMTGFVNDRQKAAIDLKKVLEQDKDYKIGMNGEEENVIFGLHAAETLTAQDGKTIPADGLLGLATVMPTGIAKFGCDIPFGKFYVQEFATDDHYILSDEQYPLTFKYEGQDKAVVTLSANDGKDIENVLKRAKVIGAKYDEDGITLGGALLGIFPVNVPAFTEKNAIFTDRSKTDGSFAFENVPYGKWAIAEVESPTGFILTDEVFIVSVEEDGQVVPVKVENVFIKGDVTVTKVDAWDPSHKLTGAEFTIYADINNDGTYDESVDKEVGKLDEVEEGIYKYENLRYGAYFLKETKAPSDAYRLDEEYYYFQILEDGKNYDIGNIEEGFGNTLKHGTLELSKTDVATGAPLPNAGFRVKDENGNVVAEGRSDNKGIVTFDRLPIGKYTYQEFDAPKGYVVDERPFAFEIKEDGEIVKASMTNKSIPVTGDEATRNAIVFACIALAACIAGGVCGWIFYKKRGKRS